jgi:hypothetical protein
MLAQEQMIIYGTVAGLEDVDVDVQGARTQHPAARLPHPQQVTDGEQRVEVVLLGSDVTVTRRSMVGFAASPGTEVEPMCSIRSAVAPRAARMRVSCSR